MRVVVDVNVWISVLLQGRLAGLAERLFEAVEMGQATLVYSSELLKELESTKEKKRLMKRFRPHQVDFLIQQIEKNGLLWEQKTFGIWSRDPKDDYLINIALECDATVLVTGDEDLLVLDPVGHLRIISPAQWEEWLN